MIYSVTYKRPEEIERLMQNPKTVLIDTRFTPYSQYYRDWNRERLINKWNRPGEPIRYRWAGATLGNQVHGSGGAIHIVDLERGLKRLKQLHEQGWTLLIMCACKEEAHCHRTIIFNHLKPLIKVEADCF